MNTMLIRRTKQCRLKLIELAQNGERMTYSQLRSYLGISKRARLDTYLDRVYDCEVRCFGRPDITLILHPDGKLHGPFISRGRPREVAR
jgi:hypothetical protein